MDQLFRPLYRLLIALACLSMVAAFVLVLLGILARQVTFIDIQGLDAYAGYAIAATLFFALPTALMHGDHIRVTLVLDRLGQRARAGFEWGALIAALGLAVYLAWFADARRVAVLHHARRLTRRGCHAAVDSAAVHGDWLRSLRAGLSGCDRGALARA